MPPIAGPAGPVALVTAASRGLGEACARELARRGWRLALLARSDGVEEVAGELGAVAVRGSVTEEEDLDALVALAEKSYGRVDGVVVNTGHPPKGDLLAISDEDWHSGLDLLLLPTVRLARRLAPAMAQRGRGAFVNISTFAAFEPSLDFPVSSALRAALGSFAKLFSDLHGAAGLRMNNVLPGFMETYPVDPDTRAAIPLGRPAAVEEVARVAAFLLSDEASYVTGQNWRVDGGLARSV